MSYVWTINFDTTSTATTDFALSTDNEASYCIDMQISRGFDDLYEVGDKGELNYFAPVQPGSCTLTFDNSSGRFSVWDSTSAMYGILYPGRAMTVKVRSSTASTDTSIFTGMIKDIRENYADKTVRIECGDGIDFLQTASAEVEFLNNIGTSTDTPYTTETAANAILSSAGYLWGTITESGEINHPYTLRAFGYKGQAYKELVELSKATFGVFYTLGDGTPVFGSVRSMRSTDTAAIYDAEVFLKNIDISQPWDNLVSDYKMVFRPLNRQPSSDVVALWDAIDEDTALTMLSSATRTFKFDWTSGLGEDVFYANMTAMAAGTDYVAVRASSTATSESTSVSITNEKAYGWGGEFTVTNIGANTILFDTLQVRGRKYFQKAREQTESAETGVPLGSSGYMSGISRTFVFDSKFYYTETGAAYSIPPVDGDVEAWMRCLGDYMGYVQASKIITVQIDTRSEQFDRDLNDAIAFNISKPDLQPYPSTDLYLGGTLSTDDVNVYRIMNISHQWQTPNGQSVLTTWRCRHAVISHDTT